MESKDNNINIKTKRIMKIIGRVLLSIFIVLYVVIALMNTTITQSIVGAKVADYFQKEWKTKFSIGAISVTPFINLGLKDVYLEDKQGDTLLYANRIEANLQSLPKNKVISIGDVRIYKTDVYLKKKNHKMNFAFIIDYFKSNKPKKNKPPSKPLTIKVKDLVMKDVNFSLLNYDGKYKTEKGLFCGSNMVYTDINAHFKDIVEIKDSIRVDIRHLSTKERCGLVLEKMQGKFVVSKKGIQAKDAKIKTNHSLLAFDCIMKTDSWHTYSSFVDSVYMKVRFKPTTIASTKDATFWNKRLLGMCQMVKMNFDCEGTINDLNIYSFDLKTGNTHIQTKGKIISMTNIKNAYFLLDINDITTSYKEFESLALGSLLKNVKLPEIVDRLGTININGKVRGMMNNFVSNLVVVSDLGNLDCSVNAQTPIGKIITNYSGKINSSYFNVGQLLNNTLLKNTAMMADFSFSGNKIDNIQGNLEARLNDFYFKNNSYNEVVVNGKIKGYDIDGLMKINDKDINLDCDYNINYHNKPSFDVKAKMTDVNLHKMHIISFNDTNTLISANVDFNSKNFDINQLNGEVNINDVKILTQNKNISINNIYCKAINNSQENNINLSSDIIDLDMKGKYTIKSLQSDIAYIVNKYIPNISAVIGKVTKQDNIKVKTKQSKNKESEPYSILSDVDFNSKIKNIEILRTLFGTNIDIDKDVDIKGKINKEDIFLAQVNIPKVKMNNILLEKADIDIVTQEKDLNVNISSQKLSLADSVGLKQLALQATIDSNNFNFLARFVDMYQDSTNGRIEFESFVDDKGLQGNFKDTYFLLVGKQININANHIISIVNKKISLMNFALIQDKGKLVFDGVLSDNYNDILTCNCSNIDLASFNPFLTKIGLNLKGKLNRDIVFRNILKNPTFTSNLIANDLVINDVEVGQAWFKVDNSLASDVFNANIKFLYKADNKQTVPLQIVGKIYPNNEKDKLDLTLKMDNFNLSILKTYLSSIASDIKGTLSCDNITIKGDFKSPNIVGVLHSNNASMKINMLNTKYYFTDNIYINDNKFSLKNFVLKDAQNNKITINGNIRHHNFQDFDIKLKAKADKIKILDTKADNGQMYYGTAFASAIVDIDGDLNMLNITASCKTEKGTNLTIPLSSKMSATENSFITFVDKNKDTSNNSNYKIITGKQNKQLGYNISIDLNVNSNANISMPMDFNQLKGNLSASGNGDLKIEIDNNGKFSMIGTVEVDNGNFKFNIMDLLEKTFIIQKGGTLTWNGQPSQGVIDVKAIYKTKASLASILGEEYIKPVDVQSIIILNGNMTNPQPKFDIALPNTDSKTVEQLFMTIDKTDEKVMLEQIASLLLTNQFYYTQNGYENNALESGVTSSVMEVAFSQLSGILTNMVKFVDIGVNYTAGNQQQKLSNQVGVNLSKTYGRFEVEMNSSFGGNSESTTNYATNETSNIIGDMRLKYKFTDNLKLEIFNRSNANDFTKYNISPYTQGARMVYNKEYNSLKDIFIRKKKK